MADAQIEQPASMTDHTGTNLSDVPSTVSAPAWQPPSSLVLLTDPTGMEAEAVRGLRTRVMAQHVREGRRALAVCTPASESGCTFTASNLAVAVAQIGIKTVLVDADLRAPTLSALFGLTARIGLAELLDEDISEIDDLDDVIHNDVLPNLSIVPAGTPPGNPQELLASGRFRTMVNQLLREFDLTIFDTTPTNTCSDAQRVATVAGYSMIVARRNVSYVNDVATLVKLLRDDRSVVIGTVLNEY